MTGCSTCRSKTLRISDVWHPYWPKMKNTAGQQMGAVELKFSSFETSVGPVEQTKETLMSHSKGTFSRLRCVAATCASKKQDIQRMRNAATSRSFPQLSNRNASGRGAL